MKRSSVLLGFLLLFEALAVTHAQDFVPGEIMIDIRHEYLPITPTPNGDSIIVTGLPSIDSLNALYGVYGFEAPANDSSAVSMGFYLLKFSDSSNVNQVLSSYLEDIHINIGSLNCIRRPYGITPSDYYYPLQWGLRKMQCPEAWRYALGSPSIVIQIIDGGTDYGHPDLVHNIWQNLGEDVDGDGHTVEWDPAENRWVLDPGDLDGYFGWDDDDNGYCDDLVGFDFRDAPCGNGHGRDPQPTNEPPGYPYYGWLDHGDQTAGTAAAVTDNSISSQEAEWICYHDQNSVAGTSWLSKIMIARISDDWDAIDALDYGMSNGASIINMSWGDTGDNALLHAKLDEAWDFGLLLIASAGNDSNEILQYPAAYSSVIAVAATDSFDVKKDYSSYGTWVDICAPGWNKTPDRDNKFWQYYCYNEFSGTSCSAPFVAGVAALVWACYPESSNTAIRTALINSADDIDGVPGNDPYEDKLGSGRANAYEAVKYYGAEPRPSGDCNGDRLVDAGDIVFLINYCFLGGPSPHPVCIADVTDNGVIDSGDVVYLIEYVHCGGAPPRDGCD